MSGRRSHPRFVAPVPWVGSIELLREVAVERSTRDGLTVICHVAGVSDEEMALNVVSAAGTLVSRVRVLESRPVIVDRAMRHRLHLVGIDATDSSLAASGVPSSDGAALSGLDALLGAREHLAVVLGRRVGVRLVDISTSGCGLETANRVEPGSAGALRILFQHEECTDDIRVVRCEAGQGSGGLYRLGATFLWTSSPGTRSLRHLVARVRAARTMRREPEHIRTGVGRVVRRPVTSASGPAGHS